MSQRTMVPMWAAAQVVNRSKHTLRQWYRDGVLASAGIDPATGDRLVDLVQAQTLSDAKPRRATRRDEASACRAARHAEMRLRLDAGRLLTPSCMP